MPRRATDPADDSGQYAIDAQKNAYVQPRSIADEVPLCPEICDSALQHVTRRQEAVLAEADTRRGSGRQEIARKQCHVGEK